MQFFQITTGINAMVSFSGTLFKAQNSELGGFWGMVGGGSVDVED